MNKTEITFKYHHQIPDNDCTKLELIKWRFDELGVKLTDLAEIAKVKINCFRPEVELEPNLRAVKSVLSKREIQNSLITAINLDVLAENKLLVGPLQGMMLDDRGTFGIDELMMNLADLYGTIALTNAEELDLHKTGIIKEVDELGKQTEWCTTFLDDQLCMIVGCAVGKLSHELEINKNKSDDEKMLNSFN